MLIGLLGIVLCIICIIFIYLCIEIKHINYQLQKYNGGEYKIRITNKMMFKETTKLAKEINRCIKKQDALKKDFFQHEKRLKESIAEISHDLRTPLTVLQGYLEMLNNTENLDKKQEYWKAIQKKNQQINDIINTFYELSMIENDGYAIVNRPFDLTELLITCIIDHSNLFQQKNLEPIIDIPNEPYIVNLDMNACQRIIDNLLTNARRYTTGNVKIQLCKRDCYYSLSVSNQAKNLSQQDVLHIFERFYQQDKSRQCKGNGLGLYIVKLLADKMGLIINSTLENGWLCITLLFHIGPLC